MRAKCLIITLILVFATNLGLVAIGIVYRGIEWEETNRVYVDSVDDYVELTNEYVRHFEANGQWPAPGTFSSSDLQFVRSEMDTTSGERVDVYQSVFDDDTKVEFYLKADGQIQCIAWPNILW